MFWRIVAPLECQELLAQLHGVISQETEPSATSLWGRHASCKEMCEHLDVVRLFHYIIFWVWEVNFISDFHVQSNVSYSQINEVPEFIKF
jgi:hypothetical protein